MPWKLSWHGVQSVSRIREGVNSQKSATSESNSAEIKCVEIPFLRCSKTSIKSRFSSNFKGTLVLIEDDRQVSAAAQGLDKNAFARALAFTVHAETHATHFALKFGFTDNAGINGTRTATSEVDTCATYVCHYDRISILHFITGTPDVVQSNNHDHFVM